MNKKDEYIEINIMSFFIFLYKNLKILILSFILLTILATAFLYYKNYNSRSGVVLKQMIQAPSYFDGSQNLHAIIDYNKLNLILQNILSELKQTNPQDKLLQKVNLLYPFDKYEIGDQKQFVTANGQNSVETKAVVKNANYELKKKYDDQKTYFTLLTQSKKADAKDISKLYQDIINKFSESTLIAQETQLWKRSIETNIQQSSEKLVEYDRLLKQDEITLKDLMAKKSNDNVVNSQTQAMIIKYITMVNDLKMQVFSLKQSIDTNKIWLSSANLKVSDFGGMVLEPKVPGVSIKLLLVVLFLIVFGSLFITMIVGFFKKVAAEAKK
ncbi:hypothetical protein IBE20_00640 [Francisella tularensis subsp. novicida]|uniref:Uncharacterized protein n=1 Tax=Francisella tularensis subsp. novicida (strain ATCC 15482 / CCUG 33449 / U112) TaxID=401614 RepID=A0Q6E8_FRATN|nr:hypothetical protein [Francisella tularensis]ABK89813.1 protein of unknown function [Francisella tularensis subsp. novicida U112]AJI61245.1 hypothetical protein AW25_1092 [Francisella tularensis subsp. novicida U112]EDX27399.1 hypothetical protein FTE_1170 [Francisella tularensis subsp. novicida FTE]MBK2035056.1 hypothetical protein [Francisella tularensis subsp. novicida]MBK2035762.1 hypothetical protein [Francisella tularensis subsp. novicida]